MKTKNVPEQAVTIRTYTQLETAAQRFAEGKINLLAVIGSAGLSKTQTFTRVLKTVSYCFINGHATAFELYKALYDFQDELVFLDDADSLYRDKNAKPLLKALCDTVATKTVAWRSRALGEEIPKEFDTQSKVAIACNDLSVAAAVADRGHLLYFKPSNREVHAEVARRGWFKDQQVYDFIGENIDLVTVPSMRYYFKAKEWKDAGASDAEWKDYCLNMMNPDLDNRGVEIVSKMLTEKIPEKDKAAIFVKQTGLCRATYFNYKKIILEARGE